MDQVRISIQTITDEVEFVRGEDIDNCTDFTYITVDNGKPEHVLNQGLEYAIKHNLNWVYIWHDELKDISEHGQVTFRTHSLDNENYIDELFDKHWEGSN